MSRPTHPAADTLLAFAHDGLSPSERAQLDAHLSTCAACARGARAFAEIGRVARDEAPPPFAMVRARRRLLASLVEERHVALSAWRPRTVMAAVLVASLSGAALAAVSVPRLVPLFADDESGRERRSSSAANDTPAPANSALAPETDTPGDVDSSSSDQAVPAPDVAAALEAAISDEGGFLTEPARIDHGARPSMRQEPAASKSRRVARAPGARTPAAALAALQADLVDAAPGDARFVDLGDLAALAGEPRVARDAYVRALAGDRAEVADQRLDRLVADGTLSEEDVLAAIAHQPSAQESAEGMKRRCATELRHRGDRAAVALCQRFGEEHPHHPAVRRLALAAGRTAEFRLDDPTLAVLEYSRAILVSEVAGVASTEALLARARAHAKIGATSAARADLGLYLHVQPEARFRGEVRALAALIGFTLEEKAP